MRFDNERASTWAEKFAAPGPEGEERATRVMAEEFRRIGLRVETRDVLGSRFAQQILPVVGWCGLGLGATLSTYLTLRGAPGPFPLTAWLVAMTGWAVATLPGLRFGHGWPPRVAARNVLAERIMDGDPPARVVFRTSLDGVVLRGPEVPWWASSATIGVVVGLLVLVLLVGTNAGHPWEVPILGVLGFLVIVRLSPYLRSGRDPGLRDNGTGLAVLLELARTWPRRADARVEAHFVAVGGQGLDGAGSRALEETIRAEWPVKPTLLIDLSAPGVGKGLILSGRRHAELAGSAAADLWVPHRMGRRRIWMTWARAVPARDDDVVWLIGDEASVPSNREGEIAVDPEAMGRAAQLATEIALRWARRIATASSESR